MPPSTHRTERPRDHRARPPPSACPAKRPVSGRGQGRQPPQAGARSASLEAGRSQVYLNTVAPRRRIRFCHRRLADRWWAEPGWADVTSTGLGISNGCQDHTVLPYAATSTKVLNGPCAARKVLAKALKRRSSCAPLDRSRKAALRSRHAPDAAASTASCPASVTIAIRPSRGE